MNTDSNLKKLEEELQKLLDIPMCYLCHHMELDETVYYFNPDEAFDEGYDPICHCYIPLTGDDYLYFLLLMSTIIKIETLSNTLDVDLFKEDICNMCIRYLNLLKELDKDNYQKLYDGLKIRIQSGIC